MTRPVIILDAHWRQVGELFSAADLRRLHDQAKVIWGRDAPIPADVLRDGLARAHVLIAATPHVDQATLDAAPHLRAVIEVSGAFPDTIDYAACAARGVEVLSCAPGFRQSVAEMTLAMVLAGARGLVAEHEGFRAGREHWLADNDVTDFTLFGAKVGFVGYGSIARVTHDLMRPFAPQVSAFDPWLPPDVASAAGVELVSLDDVLAQCRCVIIAAAPSHENKGLIGAPEIAQMPKGALLVLISRAHLVDFDAVLDATQAGHIRAAIDVFPSEPAAADHLMRDNPNLILSPHRAAAVAGGRQLIGQLILSDLAALMKGEPPAALQRAKGTNVTALAGVGDAAQVADMASQR